MDGAQGRNRTTDTAIFSRMLYQLSYLGAGVRGTLRSAAYRRRPRPCPVASVTVPVARRGSLAAAGRLESAAVARAYRSTGAHQSGSALMRIAASSSIFVLGCLASGGPAAAADLPNAPSNYPALSSGPPAQAWNPWSGLYVGAGHFRLGRQGRQRRRGRRGLRRLRARLRQRRRRRRAGGERLRPVPFLDARAASPSSPEPPTPAARPRSATAWGSSRPT